MATAGGPDIERDGLVFGYDTGYGVADNSNATRFYPGEPTTNHVTTNLETVGTDGSGQGSIGTRTTIAPNHVKIVDINSNTRQTHLISGLTGGTIYTVSIQFKKIEGTPTFRFQLQDYNGGSYLRTIKFTTTAETGLEDKYGWQTASWTFTLGSDANAVRIWWQDGADYTTYTHSFELKNPQLEAKNHVTPYASGTRSSTQSLIDLTKSTNIDVSNVSFDSTGQPTFDGTNDRIVSDAILVEGSQTFETVFMATENPHSPAGILTNHQYTSPQANFGINYVSNSGFKLGASIGYTDGSREYSSKNTTYVVQQDVAIHAVLTYDETNNRIKWYINGELDSTHNLSKTPNFESIPVCSGRWTAAYNDYYFDGYVYLGKIYNKELSADEVQQNYNAYKNRFDL